MNMHPEYPSISFEMPQIQVNLESCMDDQIFKTVANLHTVLIQPDKEMVQMLWQGNLECTRMGKTLEYTKVSYQMDETTVKN